jgi:hypothetical protein
MIKEKILCIGDNSSAEAWAHYLTKSLALKEGLVFRGQIENENYYY